MNNKSIIRLPYAYMGLEPFLSEENVRYHYSKLHNAYALKLTKLTQQTPMEHNSLTELILNSVSFDILQYAIQVYNHNFFWMSMQKVNRYKQCKKKMTIINQFFGSIFDLKTHFFFAVNRMSTPEWCWFVKNLKGELEFQITGVFHSPIMDRKMPLLVCDITEHSYYLDYRNKKKEYLQNWWSLINWNFFCNNWEKFLL